MRFFVLSLCIIVCCSPAFALDGIRSIDLSPYFSGFRESTFVLYEPEEHQFQIYNQDAAEIRRAPCSTFKIPNSIIGLETGVIKDKNHVFKWDGTKRWLDVWNQDHTLETALKNSVVWYYQELARQVGKEKMQEFVDQIKYGNQDLSGAIDHFWLGDSLQISAMEQIRFLQRFYSNKLPFSQTNIDTVKEIMIYKTGDDFVLRGKTGSGMVKGETSWGWYVGYLESGGKVYIFAANAEAKEGATGRAVRDIVIQIFEDKGMMK